MPAVLVFNTVRAVEFADALAQVALVPDRFVDGSQAGMRTTALLRADWDSLDMAR